MSNHHSRYRLNAAEAASRSRASMSYIAYDHALQEVLDGLYTLITNASGTGEFAITVTAEQLLDLFIRAGVDISASTKEDPGIGDIGAGNRLGAIDYIKQALKKDGYYAVRNAGSLLIRWNV